jgi:2-polyprenyl-6-methoxyphenol hydroxylase-like FAD-dependent oxidoreductase
MKVLIAGASIAGPSLAFWLTRYGAEVTVLEQAAELRKGGQLVDVRGSARGVLARAGLAETVAAACTASDGLSFVDSNGRRLATLGAADFGGDGPVTDTEILRGRLSEIFHEATSDSAEYLFGDRIAGLADGPGGVRVTFEKAAPRTYDVVIGADGLHSGVRKLAFGPDAPPLRHLGAYLSFWTAENHLGLRDWTEAYSEPGRTMGMRTIHGNSAVMAFMSFTSAEFRYDYRDPESLKVVLRARAAGMGWECDRLIEQIDQAPDFYFDSCSQVRLPHWSVGNVGLVGDAAYCASPLSGHGTTIALVGAYVLAGELAKAGADHQAGLAAYERTLRPWITEIQEFGAGNGKTMTPETALGVWLRNTVSRFQRFVPSGLFAGQIRMSNRFVLPDYSRYGFALVPESPARENH